MAAIVIQAGTTVEQRGGEVVAVPGGRTLRPAGKRRIQDGIWENSLEGRVI